MIEERSDEFIGQTMKKFGSLLLFIVCSGLLLHSVWTFLLPPWASAEIFGADIFKGLLIFLCLAGMFGLLNDQPRAAGRTDSVAFHRNSTEVLAGFAEDDDMEPD